MGITIESENFGVDMGAIGFMRFRSKVATLVSKNFGHHYSKLIDGTFLYGDARVKFFEKYDKETRNFVECDLVSDEVANFCYQSDIEGSISQNQAQLIYEVIKDYDDDICYGYSGRSDCAMFKDLKNIFKDCAENGGDVEWS